MEYNNLSIRTSRNVYEPSDDTFLAAMAIESALAGMKGKKLSILDIGTGTGILGLVGCTNGRVGRATFADINAGAVRLAKQNYQKNRERVGAKCTFVKTNLFSRIRGKYDLVIFNSPYLPSDENSNSNILNKAWNGGIEGIDVGIRFLEGLGRHMEKNGRALMVISSFGNLKKLRNEAIRLGFRTRTVGKKHIFFEDIIVMEIRNA